MNYKSDLKDSGLNLANVSENEVINLLDAGDNVMASVKPNSGILYPVCVRKEKLCITECGDSGRTTYTPTNIYSKVTYYRVTK